MTLAVGLLLNLAAIWWYYKNIGYVIQHISVASSGPIAEIYGKKDNFLNAMIYWLGALRESFFLPSVLLIIGLTFVFGIIYHFIRPNILKKHFTICSVIAVSQTILVLAVFSLSSNRDQRYLLPLLPYLVLLISWSLVQITR